MMELLIQRKWRKEKYTIGWLYVDGVPLCNTLEDPDRGLASWMSEAAIKAMKIAGNTAIPTGTYDVVLSVSPKFKYRVWAKKYGGLVPEILNVKGYSGIRIHPGTDASSTEGCLLVGDNKEVGKLLNSQKRYYELMDKYLFPAWENGEKIRITIK